MLLKPLGNNILVEISKSDDVTEGGIFLPDNSKEEKSEGVVITLGIDAKKVSVGETVIFGKYAGQDIKFQGKNLRILKESEVLAVLSK